MEYIYAANENYEDYASGRVIYSKSKVPNFPVRLTLELFGRALSYSEKKDNLSVYDPCCGGGYLLTILGLYYGDLIQELYGSDIDEEALALAKKNMTLLSNDGINEREQELEKLYELYGKESHKDALESISVFRSKISGNLKSCIFQADCTKTLPSKAIEGLSMDDLASSNRIAPDIIITDVPYGNLVDWKDANDSINEMIARMAEISETGSILVLCMDKKQKAIINCYQRMEQQVIGKRKFEILKRI